MIEIIIFSVFFAGIVIGGLIADATGRLPSAEELQAEDRARSRADRERARNGLTRDVSIGAVESAGGERMAKLDLALSVPDRPPEKSRVNAAGGRDHSELT